MANLPRSNEALGGPVACWTATRIELRDWLRRNSPSLAELYEGAVELVFVRTPPGWTRFVCHAVREIRNRLPDAITGPVEGGTVQYTNRLDRVSSLWQRVGFGRDGSVPGLLRDDGEEIPSSPDVNVPIPVIREIGELVRDHNNARERPFEAATRLFEAIAPENQHLRDVLRPILENWIEVTHWFVQRAHDAGTVDSEFDQAELRAKFELFEGCLGSVAREFFATVKDLNSSS